MTKTEANFEFDMEQISLIQRAAHPPPASQRDRQTDREPVSQSASPSSQSNINLKLEAKVDGDAETEASQAGEAMLINLKLL